MFNIYRSAMQLHLTQILTNFDKSTFFRKPRGKVYRLYIQCPGIGDSGIYRALKRTRDELALFLYLLNQHKRDAYTLADFMRRYRELEAVDSNPFIFHREKDTHLIEYRAKCRYSADSSFFQLSRTTREFYLQANA